MPPACSSLWGLWLGHMARVSASRPACSVLCSHVSLPLSNKHLVIVFRTHQDQLGWSPRPKVPNQGCEGSAVPGTSTGYGDWDFGATTQPTTSTKLPRIIPIRACRLPPSKTDQ